MTLLMPMNNRGNHGVSCGGDIYGFGLALLEPIMVVRGRLNGVLKHSFSEGK